MKFVFSLAFCALSGSSLAFFGHAADGVDKSTDLTSAINDYRNKDITLSNKLADLTVDTSAKTALATEIKDMGDNNTCTTIPTAKAEDTFDRAVFTYTDTEEAELAIDDFFNQIKNYDCVYPPTTDSLKGSVDYFTYMMADSTTGFACYESAGCDTEIVMCYFTPKFTGTANQPFDKAMFDAIAKRDEVCSGEYFGQFAGLFSITAAVALAWGYTAA